MTIAVKTQMQFHRCVLPISDAFYKAIDTQVHKAQIADVPSSMTLHYRDTSYSSEAGGYHPVEISIMQGDDDKWHVNYITDFAYFGLGYPELERDIDFDIGNQMAFATGIGWQKINSSGFIELYRSWEANFLAYLDMDAFDSIIVKES
ncbi:MAG: DUF2787 family protein [Cyanobacteria bacterium J06555_13]